VTAPDGRTMQSAGARLGPDDVPLPRTLGLLHERGALGPFTVVARGFRGGSSAVVTRTARFFFQTGRTLVLQMELLERCRGARCGDGETCGTTGCRAIDVAPAELTPWSGGVPSDDASMPGTDASVVADASVGRDGAVLADGCSSAPEACNGRDDDCDARVDEDAPVAADPSNCGACGVRCGAGETCSGGRCVCGTAEGDVGAGEACAGGANECCGGACIDTSLDAAHCGGCGDVCRTGANASPACRDGRCRLACATGFGDCNGDADDGCETNLLTSTRNCGACGTRCSGATNACCAGVCSADTACP